MRALGKSRGFFLDEMGLRKAFIFSGVIGTRVVGTEAVGEEVLSVARGPFTFLD